MTNNLLVILPAFNEDENIAALVQKWMDQEFFLQEHNVALEILIVDDGSHDDTEKVIISLEKIYDNLSHINHMINKGLGKALLSGIDFALNKRTTPDYVLVMDGDNTQDPKYAISMIIKAKTLKDEAVIIASRYQKGAHTYGVPLYRRFLSMNALIVYSLGLGVKDVRDYTCGYRLYNINILKKGKAYFGENLVEEAGFGCMVELLYKLHLLGGSFSEIPFDLHYDEKVGNSKMDVWGTIVSSLKLIKTLRKLKSSMATKTK